MLRLLPLLLFPCAVFWACSSDADSSLKNWFDDQGLAVSYEKDPVEVDISVESVSASFESSINMVSGFAALGNVNNLKHTLYFGLQINDSMELKPVWKLRIDTTFYSDFNKEPSAEISARVYWLSKSEDEHDSIWLKFEKPWEDSVDIVLNIADKIIDVTLPEILNAPNNNLLVGLELLSEGEILRIAPPNIDDVGKSLLRVAQKTIALPSEQTYLYSGVGDSLLISFAIDKDANEKIRQSTVVFAQIVLPKQNDNLEDSELGYPLPVYVYDTLSFLEAYRVDTVYVNDYGHPNLLFLPEIDSLTLQVTRSVRRVNAADTALNFVLKLVNPILNTKSHSFNFANRPAYARYDFGYLRGEKAKLKLWFADYGDDKK